MPEPPPILDPRTLKEILRQLQRQAHTSVSEWTPSDNGDAGTMMQLAYARLLEILLERLNQVPEKNLLAFLDTMGVSLLPSSSAKAPLTFALKPGTAPTFIPQGMQSGTQPNASQPAVLFETDDDLTVIPAQLIQAFTIDPIWDRYTDQTVIVEGKEVAAFTSFVGTKPLPHILYLGDSDLLSFSRSINIALIVGDNETFPDLIDSPISWQYKHNGELKSVDQLSFGELLRFGISNSIDQEYIQGAGLESGIQGRWLQVKLKTPFADSRVEDLRLNDVRLRIRNSAPLLPDLAFSNTTLIDTTKDFLPLGEKPRIGDTFYFSNEEAFSKPEAEVTLSIQLPPPPTLVWEYYGSDPGEPEFGRVWVQIPRENIQDETNVFQMPGRNLLINLNGLNAVETELNGTIAYWIKVRIVSGSWLNAPLITNFVMSARGVPVGFFNDQQFYLTQPFFPFGQEPVVGDTFYFGFTGTSGTAISLRVNIHPDWILYTTLAWEYLSSTGWIALPILQRNVSRLIASGEFTFKCPDDVARQRVNGQEGRWIRARLTSGDYGREPEYIPVNINDPSRGFKLRPKTGIFAAPILRSLKISYEATKSTTIIRQTGFVYEDLTEQNEESFAPFIPVSDPELGHYSDREPAFYLGFDATFSEQPVSLYISVAPRAFTGRIIKSRRAIPLRSSTLPPLQWEYFNGTTWIELTVIDGTNHFTESGLVKFLTPTDIEPLVKFDLTERYWIRARSSANHPFDTQRLQGVFLNTVPATQAVTIANEILGSSNGRDHQTFRLVRSPALPGQQVTVREPEIPPDREYLSITQEENTTSIQQRINSTTGETEIWVRWHEVPNFIQSDSYSRHYTLDHATGVIQFGDGKRGIIPPLGTNNITATYRVGGGVAGNVSSGAIAQIKTPRPGVASVMNPIAAEGGAPPETVPMVIERGPQTLRHRDRAVTCSDLEWLARQAVGTLIARSKCLPNLNQNLQYEPGWVTLLIVPSGNGGKLVPGSEVIRQVEDYLSDRAFIGLTQQTPARINVIGSGYIQVAVKADVVPRDIDHAQQVKQHVLSSLDAFFHALTGGPAGTGWEFGRDVYVSELCQQLEGVPGVSHVKRLQVFSNLVQNRLELTSPLTSGIKLPVGSRVMTVARHRMALLAEPIPAGIPTNRIVVKGFQEGDRITQAFDVTVREVFKNHIMIRTISSDYEAPRFPRGSVVLTLDGTQRTHLKTPILGTRDVTQIDVEDTEFVRQLQPNDVLTLLYPFPMTVMAATMIVIEDASVVSLAIAPYEADITFRRQSVFATLDNQIRLPSFEVAYANQTLTTLKLQNFEVDDRLTIAHPNHSSISPELTLADVQSVEDIVYLDDNFLVYSGKHRITMVNDTNVDEEVKL